MNVHPGASWSQSIECYIGLGLRTPCKWAFRLDQARADAEISDDARFSAAIMMCGTYQPLKERETMFERIVAAVDTDEDRGNQVIAVAQELGEKFRSEVLVVHVRQLERPAAIAAGRPGALPPAISIETEERAQQLVNSAVNKLRGAGVRARGEIGPGAGSTARELLEIARTFGANLILAGDRDSRVTDVLLGGVAHRIVHQAECPVLLVR